MLVPNKKSPKFSNNDLIYRRGNLFYYHQFIVHCLILRTLGLQELHITLYCVGEGPSSGIRRMLQHRPTAVTHPRRQLEQPRQHQEGAGVHRGGHPPLPEGTRGIPRVCCRPQQSCIHSPATGKIE